MISLLIELRVENNLTIVKFKEKLDIGNNSAAIFDTKFINIAELLTKFFKNLSIISFCKDFDRLINID